VKVSRKKENAGSAGSQTGIFDTQQQPDPPIPAI
jgi:hypothetical protein